MSPKGYESKSVSVMSTALCYQALKAVLHEGGSTCRQIAQQPWPNRSFHHPLLPLSHIYMPTCLEDNTHMCAEEVRGAATGPS